MSRGNPPRVVLLVRHGETEWSAQHRHTGQTDLPLTEVGQVEAMNAGGVLLAMLGIDEPTAVYVSPRQRAQVTARLVLGDAASAATVTDLIAEYDYGAYEGRRGAEIAAEHPGWDLWVDGCPGGETPEQVIGRADAFVERCCREASDGVVVAFTHGHMSRALTARFLGEGAELARVLHNDTASIAELRSRDGRLALTGWNVRPHGAAIRTM